MTLFAPVAWGTTYVTVTELLPPNRPMFVALMRMLPAGVIMAAGGIVLTRWRPRQRQWLHISALALVNFGLFFPLLIVAVYRLPGGVAASFGGLQPLLVAVLGRVIEHRPLRARDFGVGAVAALGVALVVIRPGANVDLVGALSAAGANISFAVGVVLTKRWPMPAHRVAATGWQLVIGAALLGPVALATEGPPPPLDTADLVGLAHLSLVATGLAFAIWFRGVERLPAAAPPLLGLAAPFTGAALGWLIRSEDLTPVQLVGFALTAGAIAYGTLVVPARLDEPRPGPDNMHDHHRRRTDGSCAEPVTVPGAVTGCPRRSGPASRRPQRLGITS